MATPNSTPPARIALAGVLGFIGTAALVLVLIKLNVRTTDLGGYFTPTFVVSLVMGVLFAWRETCPDVSTTCATN